MSKWSHLAWPTLAYDFYTLPLSRASINLLLIGCGRHGGTQLIRQCSTVVMTLVRTFPVMILHDFAPCFRCPNGRIWLGRPWHKTFTPFPYNKQPLTQIVNFRGYDITLRIASYPTPKDMEIEQLSISLTRMRE